MSVFDGLASDFADATAAAGGEITNGTFFAYTMGSFCDMTSSIENHAPAAGIVLVAAALFVFAGCMTPERAVREADESGNRLVREFVERVTGRTNDFTIARPSDRLRNRLLLEQNLDSEIRERLLEDIGTNRPPLPDPLVLSLMDAMQVGAANDNDFQEQKESLFKAALSYEETRHTYESLFSGTVGGTYSGAKSTGGEFSSSAGGSASSSLSKKLKNGMTAAATLGLDITKILTGGGLTRGLSADTSISIPLLRGAGRLIATEELTQAERNLVYAVHDFEAYRQSYAVEVAQSYYAMLQSLQSLQALKDNAERLTANYKRAQMLFEAGKQTQVELDQTRQDLLSSRDNLNQAERSTKAKIDDFKVSLGLPLDARVELDMGELDKLRDSMKIYLASTNEYGQPLQPELRWTEEEAIAIALTNRHSVLLAKWRLEDSRRSLKITEDQLRWDLSLSLGGKLGTTKSRGSDATKERGYNAGLSSELPWDRLSERNAYRTALIAIDAAERSFANLIDTTRQLVREDIRSINQAWSSFVIQSEALEVAERRVHSTTLFQQAGKSSTRDLLEAEAALLTARNSYVSAIVTYRMADLKLRDDLSLLQITEEGILLED